MSLNILEQLALVLIGSALLLSMARLLLGPTAPDRVVAADTLAVITTSSLALLAWLFHSPLYLDLALVLGSLAFIGGVAIARAIDGGAKSGCLPTCFCCWARRSSFSVRSGCSACPMCITVSRQGPRR